MLTVGCRLQDTQFKELSGLGSKGTPVERLRQHVGHVISRVYLSDADEAGKDLLFDKVDEHS